MTTIGTTCVTYPGISVEGSLYSQQRALAGFGYNAGYYGFTMILNQYGNMGATVAVVGTGRHSLAAASYGGDKAIFGHGIDGAGSTVLSMTNLVSKIRKKK